MNEVLLYYEFLHSRHFPTKLQKYTRENVKARIILKISFCLYSSVSSTKVASASFYASLRTVSKEITKLSARECADKAFNPCTFYKAHRIAAAFSQLLQNLRQRLSAVITPAERFDDARLPDDIAASRDRTTRYLSFQLSPSFSAG